MANTKLCKKPEKCLKPWHMGTHLRVLNKSYLMNTNITGFRCFSKIAMINVIVNWTKVASALEGLNIIVEPSQ